MNSKQTDTANKLLIVTQFFDINRVVVEVMFKRGLTDPLFPGRRSHLNIDIDVQLVNKRYTKEDEPVDPYNTA